MNVWTDVCHRGCHHRVLKANPWFADMLLDWRPAGDAIYRDLTEADNRVSNGQARRRIRSTFDLQSATDM